MSQGLGHSTIRKDIQIIGAGGDGAIKINPGSLDFGTITVDFAKTLSVDISNTSNVNLYIELKMVQNCVESQKSDTLSSSNVQ